MQPRRPLGSYSADDDVEEITLTNVVVHSEKNPLATSTPLIRDNNSQGDQVQNLVIRLQYLLFCDKYVSIWNYVGKRVIYTQQQLYLRLSLLLVY